MSDGSPFGEQQLELFGAARSSRPQPRRHVPGWFMVSLRHDQAILAGIAALIGVTVVFAAGVERGKQLTRSERALLSRAPAGEETPVAPAKEPAPDADTSAAGSGSEERPAPRRAPTTSPQAAPALKTKVAADATRYAVQVVSYSRPQRAKQELDRLQSSGERAFLVIREGVTVVFVGPFPSRDDAVGKLPQLRDRYHDCFVKTL